MKIVVAATDEQWEELGHIGLNSGWQRIDDSKDFIPGNDTAAFFSLKDNNILPNFASLGKPVFINSVVHTLKELNAPGNVLRINGWSTFLNRPVWEVAGVIDKNIEAIFENLHIKITAVPDEPGLIAARIISMIINEAYFTVSDKVSSKKEIDTAMKLGTNYPYGPFEWASMIGPGNVLELLLKLRTTDKRYEPAELLGNEINEKN